MPKEGFVKLRKAGKFKEIIEVQPKSLKYASIFKEINASHSGEVLYGIGKK